MIPYNVINRKTRAANGLTWEGQLSDPQTGREKVRVLSAIPAKDILKNKARVCPPVSAICEIVDNLFDNFEENGSKRDLAVSFVVSTEGEGEISIAENSGGIRETKLEPLVRLGVAYHGAKGSIGTWGEGFKVAAFSLGTEVEIATHFPGELPVVVQFGKGWLESPDWNVPVYSLSDDAPQPGSTVFRVRSLARKIDWAEIMREVSVIYGHKIQSIVDAGRRVHIEFEIDGKRTRVTPRPLASPENLRKKLAFVPDFAPRQFTATWRAEHGTVKCRLILGLTPRHSTETSGVYMYGNGRMFARALRTRAVGYGESGSAVLRDHPSCWRIHAYAFFEADEGADIPWQAPLKDGVSENHVVTAKFREMFKEAVSPYSKFAKIAKAADLMPFTEEWASFTDEEKAEILFGRKSEKAVELFETLPDIVRDFSPPTEIETVRIDGVAGEESIKKLDQHAKYIRQMITKRDAAGPLVEVEVLRALNPSAFDDDDVRTTRPNIPPNVVPMPKRIRVTIEVEEARLKKLRQMFGTTSDAEAVRAAVKFAVSNPRTARVNKS